MKTRQISLAFALIAGRLLAASGHTWVSGTGSDSNTGTRSSPFGTFQTAVDNTTAGGVVSVADPGDFGPVSISKAITIDGGGPGGTIAFPTGYAGSALIIVTAGAGDIVILRHLTIDGLGQTADLVNIFSGQQVTIEDCHLEKTSNTGLYVASAATNVVVRNTTITGTGYGIYVTASGSNQSQLSIRGVTISSASIVAVNMVSGLAEISDSVITQNGTALLTYFFGTAAINIANSVISYNTTEIVAGGVGVFLANNNTIFANNGTGANGGGPLSRPVGPRASDRRDIPPGVKPGQDK